MNSIRPSNLVRSEGDPRIVRSGPSSLEPADRAARLIGWFSIGLGLVEVIAPRRLSRALGLEGEERFVRACGVRELGAGAMTLSTDKHAGLCARAAGDALDLLALLPALSHRNPKRRNATTALALVAGITLADVLLAQATGRRRRRSSDGLRDYSDRSGFPKGLPLRTGVAA